MQVVDSKKALRTLLDDARSKGKTIGLVPTMGALHEGHASLVRRSVSENDFTVVSDFVNPTQFNDKNDLVNYPRSLKADCTLLESLGVDVVFAPTVEEMYPEPDVRVFSFPPTDEVMEGAFRPGHFNGVCQVVSKLFYAVKPDKAYFGEKDYQQIAVIKAMVKSLELDLEICPCPIVREKDGLALSSRNALLTEGERSIATNISKYLFESKEYMKTHPDIDYFIYGHRHIELELTLNRKARMLILGDWISQFTYAVFDGEHLLLEEYVEGESRP